MSIDYFCDDFMSIKVDTEVSCIFDQVHKYSIMTLPEFTEIYEHIKSNTILIDKILEQSLRHENNDVALFIIKESGEYMLVSALEFCIINNKLLFFKRCAKEFQLKTTMTKESFTHLYYLAIDNNNTKFLSILFS